MKVTAKKFNAIVTILLVLVIQIVIYGELQGNNQSTDSSLMIASGVCLAVFIVEVISWKKLTNELLSPYIVFLFVLFASFISFWLSFVLIIVPPNHIYLPNLLFNIIFRPFIISIPD